MTTSTAQRWADDRGMPLFETSAKDDSVADHVEGIFLTLAHKLREGRSMIEPLTDPSNPDNRPVSVWIRLFQLDFLLLKVIFFCLRCEFCIQVIWLLHLKITLAVAVFDPQVEKLRGENLHDTRVHFLLR